MEDTALPVVLYDNYFPDAQVRRLQLLMRHSQEAVEEAGPPLTPEEKDERDALIKTELLASAQ